MEEGGRGAQQEEIKKEEREKEKKRESLPNWTD